MYWNIRKFKATQKNIQPLPIQVRIDCEQRTSYLCVEMAAEEEDVAAEVEAVQAVYGDDCVVLDSYPPHLHLHIKPRTADVASQQVIF